MKIAFVYDAVYPWEKGGAQKRVWELARRLATDHDVHLYGMQYWDGARTIERENVTLHGVCPPYELYHKGRRGIPQALRFAAHLTPPLLREHFDVIDCQQFPYFPIFTAKAHEVLQHSRLVVTWYEVWDTYWYDYLGLPGALGRGIERITARLPTHIVPISTFVRDDLTAIGRTTEMTVVENGVDYADLQDTPPADVTWDVIYVGRLTEHKNVELLLDALYHTTHRVESPIRAAIIGDGPERARLEAHADRIGLGDTVEFLGFVDEDDEVIANLKAATVFVLPSRREGFPNTILEANACGVPSIVVEGPENGSTAVVADEVTGYITPATPEAVADRIAHVLTDPQTRENLAHEARAYARSHDWDVIRNELEQVYSRVAERGQ